MGHISPTEIFANTFRNGTRWIHIFFPVTLLGSVVSSYFMYSWMVTGLITGGNTFWLELGVLVLAMLLLWAFQIALFDAVLENRGDWLESSLKRAAWRLLPLFVGIVVFYLIYIIGLILLIIPGLMAIVLLSMMMPLIVLDGVGPFKAVQESYDLVWGNAWLYVAASFLVVLPIMAVIVPAMLMPDVRATVLPMGEPEVLDFTSGQVWLWLCLNAAASVFYTVFYLESFKALKKAQEEKRNAMAETAA